MREANQTSHQLDFDSMPVALLQLNSKRRIFAMNAAAESLLGFSRDIGAGKRISDIVYHDCGLLELLDKAEAGFGQVSADGIRLNGPSLKLLDPFSVSIASAPENGFAIVFNPGAANASSDVNTVGLAAFSRILGHEVKNPLAGLSGATQLLLRRAREDQRELLELILSESGRITRLIDKLSAFELFSKPKLLPCNIHKVLEQVIRAEEVVFGKNVTLERNFDPSLPEIDVDADHLHEAFQNIIRNAAEAVRDHARGNKVIISTRFSLARHNKSADRSDTFRSIRVSIEDNGPGITKKDQKGIFEMFRTSKADGSGLGLTIASQIIEAHAGQIVLASQPGKTVFNIYLPIVRAR